MYCTSVSYALRASVHQTLGVSPGSLVFHRDMMYNIPIIADYEMIRQQRQAKIDFKAARENMRRRFHDYNVGDEVLLIVPNPDKLEQKAIGPFTVVQVHLNGTLTIQRNEVVYDRISVRRVKPYNRREH